MLPKRVRIDEVDHEQRNMTRRCAYTNHHILRDSSGNFICYILARFEPDDGSGSLVRENTVIVENRHLCSSTEKSRDIFLKN